MKKKSNQEKVPGVELGVTAVRDYKGIYYSKSFHIHELFNPENFLVVNLTSDKQIKEAFNFICFCTDLRALTPVLKSTENSSYPTCLTYTDLIKAKNKFKLRRGLCIDFLHGVYGDIDQYHKSHCTILKFKDLRSPISFATTNGFVMPTNVPKPIEVTQSELPFNTVYGVTLGKEYTTITLPNIVFKIDVDKNGMRSISEVETKEAEIVIKDGELKDVYLTAKEAIKALRW